MRTREGMAVALTAIIMVVLYGAVLAAMAWWMHAIMGERWARAIGMSAAWGVLFAVLRLVRSWWAGRALPDGRHRSD